MMTNKSTTIPTRVTRPINTIKQPNPAFDVSRTNIRNYIRRLVCEFFGTFLSTFTSAWAALSISNTSVNQPNRNAHINVFENAIIAGMTLCGLSYGLGHISGAHFNPSISLAFVMHGDMRPVSWFPYMIAQVGGGFFAAAILASIFINDEAHGYLGANYPKAGFTVNAAFWAEFIACLIQQTAVIGMATRGENTGGHAALAGGLTRTAMISMLTPYGGGSLNPARRLGPGMLAANNQVKGAVWIYVVSPLVAALLSGSVLRVLIPNKSQWKAANGCNDTGIAYL